MGLKLAVAAAAVLVVTLVVVLFVLPADEERPTASLSVPTAGMPAYEPPRSGTVAPSFIPPASTPPPPPPSSTSESTPSSAAPQAVAVASGRVSFYGARNNDPPGSRAIAYTNVLHEQAGGTGTFEDPITFAAGTDRYQPGTKIYVPDLKRYFILEDLCPQCSGTAINVWTGTATDSGSADCQRSLSQGNPRTYEIGPPPGRAVVPGDLYQNGRCFRP